MNIRQTVVMIALVLACPAGFVQAETLRLADGTPVHVRLTADLVSSQAEGSRVDFVVAQAVSVGGKVVIPEGSVAWGGVQTAKAGKTLRIDIEGVRLPDLKIVKLRCLAQKTTHAYKDEIKIESHVGADLGAPKGSQFTAYLDQEVTVEVAGAPPSPTPPAAAPPTAPAPAAPSPAEVKTPAVETPPEAPEPVTAPPVLAPKPPTPPVPPATPAVPAVEAQPGERITLECFSDPLGADILIDGEYHGNTPSILKIPPGTHTLEYHLADYKSHTETLNLTPSTGLRTIRVILVKQE